jgi:hypothetical protein
MYTEIQLKLDGGGTRTFEDVAKDLGEAILFDAASLRSLLLP